MQYLFPFRRFSEPILPPQASNRLDEVPGPATSFYRRNRTARETQKMAKASWGGKIIAESNATVVVEGNQYFPPEAVKKENLKASNHTTICPWKGTAHYYHVEVNGIRNDNAAWYYPEPKPAAAEIKDRIAFWKGVRVKA
jgi:uncharacterized protein (DUF427 family)